VDDVVAVVTDLFFQSRIQAAAGVAGRSVRIVTSPDSLESVHDPALVLIDLDAQADVLHLIGALKSGTSCPVVAFGPHLDTAKRKAAREAGADRVLAKSKFVTVLPDLMRDRRSKSEAGGSAPA